MAGFLIGLAMAVESGHRSLVAAEVSATPPDRDVILFLRLRVTGDGAELLEAHRVPGRIAPSRDRRGTLEIAVSDPGNTWQEIVRVDDPCRQRFEVEDPLAPGHLTWVEVPQAEGEVQVRLAARNDARHLSVARLLTPATGPLRALAAPTRLALGEFDLPPDSSFLTRGLAPQGIGQPPTNSVPEPQPAQPILLNLATQGPSAHRVDITFLAEGFRTNELDSFKARASAAFNQLLQTPPFADYESHFNAVGVFVPSVESGADHPSRNIVRDTYFDATYDSSGINRLITLSSEGRSRAFSLLREQTPAYDLAVVLVNDEEYGGSGGIPLIASVEPRSALIAVHEIGHAYAGLGDEYEDPYPGYPDIEEPNTTTETARDQIKWRAWIAASTPVPTPATTTFDSAVGLFEGAHYQAKGWFRPKLNCGMRTLGSAFCEVCAEQLILETHRRTHLIESTRPGTESILDLPAFGDATLALEVTGVQPAYQPLLVSWEINGNVVPGADGPSLVLRGSQLVPGTNQVVATLRDATTKVRTDPGGYLEQSVSWSVSYLVAPPFLQTLRLANSLRLQWVESGTVFQLESTSSLVDDAWETVADPPGQDGANRTVEVPLDNALRYFRLRSK